ncbi:putative 4-hydroxybenzoate polyprenyl transferase protein [Botrytis fragariae]|uniref:Putative 4-hydroxybenzoate polyprenyl transferase protein n=1 Tax=Botrytis fragariae TaxID=1964551 RepID=A0A8H6EN90_9HELO|nr:putative 4-hydroxybenzoate polyprenyl transferase protein [Botrytis fragariae]KAF5878130.1 putative 4-hydroxybenzoate polyprenyl transferase protein [Botrytis fragariae]
MATDMKADTNPRPLSLLPATWVPYAQLMRMEKPADYFAFYFPHIAGLLLAQFHAANLSLPRPSFEQRLVPHLYILSGCLFLRGAACTWNNFLDAPYDRQVAQCRLRPIARNTVSGPAALVFMAIQTVLGVLTILAPLPQAVRAPATLLSATQVVYPLCKRFTDYPQLWLGASFAFGVGVGTGAGGVDLLEMCGRLDALASNLKDDLKAGAKSLAVAWRNNTKRNCAVLAGIEIALLVATSILGKLTTSFNILAIGGTILVLITILYSVKPEDPESCMSYFKWLIWGTGATLSLRLLSA